ncbi:MAG: SDR family oxidoreductase [Woeseiaceae bacterium]|nr:SDR family oxidoreductase [Woeseiaceae bacterium]
MADPKRLYGLKAVVTSAGSGIGEAVARTLAKHGATVLAVDEENSGVEQLFRSVKGVEGVPTSLRETGKLTALVETAIDKLDGIDILVCDFPLQPSTPITVGDDSLDRLLDRRAELTMAICRAALPHLKKSPSGRIVNIGFLRSVFSAEAGAASRRAEQNLASITRALAAEIGEFGITANYVQPGAIMTPSSRDVFRRNTDLRDYCIANSAARRLGEPVDVAKVVLFLASDDAMFVNGSGIAVDGGRTDT